MIPLTRLLYEKTTFHTPFTKSKELVIAPLSSVVFPRQPDSQVCAVDIPSFPMNWFCRVPTTCPSVLTDFGLADKVRNTIAPVISRNEELKPSIHRKDNKK